MPGGGIRVPEGVRAPAALPHSSRNHVKRVAVVYLQEVNGVMPFPVTTRGHVPTHHGCISCPRSRCSSSVEALMPDHTRVSAETELSLIFVHSDATIVPGWSPHMCAALTAMLIVARDASTRLRG